MHPPKEPDEPFTHPYCSLHAGEVLSGVIAVR